MRLTLALFVLGLAGACASPNYYRRAVSKEETCCDKLADPAARDACKAKIRRVDTPAAETASTNQETFQCVDRNFTCDPSTGGPTKESAQAQFDCINQLESTQPAQ